MGTSDSTAPEGIAGMRCASCGTDSAPPQPTCPYCGSDQGLTPGALPVTGRLYSYTIVHVPPEGRENESPYALAIVELDGGARISARIESNDFGRLAIDAPLRLVRESGGVHFFELL